ncbi:MAG: hypothetical protein ACRD3V_00355 [Vicinamibacteria bacterium]
MSGVPPGAGRHNILDKCQPKRKLSTAGFALAAIYAALFVCALAYTIVFADSGGELLYLTVLLLPWSLIAAPLFSYFEGSDLALHVFFGLVNTVLIYRIGKKLSGL